MYIELNLNIIYYVLALLGCIALLYLIITLSNLNKLLKNSNDLVVENKSTINDSISKLPEVISNVSEVSENVKDITDVATDMTADFIVTKENVKFNIETITEILNIVKSVFGK